MTLGLVLCALGVAWLNGFFGTVVTWQDTVFFLIEIAILIVVFSLLAKRRTKGELRWRWGKTDDSW